MGENLSLFGWPLPEPREKAGRPEHEPSDENRCKVMMLVAFGKTNAEIAKAVGLSQPTLRKHYLQQLEQRRSAMLQLKASRWAALYKKAVVDGDTSALKELGREIERQDVAELSAAFGAKGRGEPKSEKRGKKEQAQIDAEKAHEDSEWGEDLLPGSGAVN